MEKHFKILLGQTVLLNVKIPSCNLIKSILKLNIVCISAEYTQNRYLILHFWFDTNNLLIDIILLIPFYRIEPFSFYYSYKIYPFHFKTASSKFRMIKVTKHWNFTYFRSRNNLSLPLKNVSFSFDENLLIFLTIIANACLL